MKVIDALKKGEPTLSFEFFPPKTAEHEKRLFDVLARLKKFDPDFASVTCGALGSNKDKTLFWAKEIKDKYSIEPVVHLTCVSATKDSILKQLEEVKKEGIENILALRGDPPEGRPEFTPPENGFAHAKELVAFIRSHRFDFCLGVAGYPEGHRESASLEKDTQYLKEKIDSGADYVISQLFFDNRYFFDFMERCLKVGLQLPIIPGIMPITSVKQVEKMVEICGATIPAKLLAKLEKHAADKKGVVELGVEQAVSQCQELLEAEVPGLHFFVMNQSGPISQILKELKPFRQQ
jgi:methylenetetrahydrofolate reductase (NADPH)